MAWINARPSRHSYVVSLMANYEIGFRPLRSGTILVSAYATGARIDVSVSRSLWLRSCSPPRMQPESEGVERSCPLPVRCRRRSGWGSLPRGPPCG